MRVQDEKIKGFNVLELIIVVAIIGVLSAISYPNFSEWRKDRQVRSDVIKIKSMLFSYFTKIDKAKINEGMQYNRIFLLNSKSISLLYITCRKLIVIENGSKRLRTSKKL